MRHHPRRPLPPSAEATLRRWQSEVDAEWAREPLRPVEQRRPAGAVADAHWSNRRSFAMKVVRRALAIMASPDMERCMYCEHDRGGEIDHGQPKSEALHRTYDWNNHVWACGRCNVDKLTRYHAEMVVPTVDDPLAFLDLAAEGRWTASDETGRGQATLDTLPYLNEQRLVTGRARRRRTILNDLAVLARQPSVTPQEVDELRAKFVDEPFSDVFAAVLAALRLPGAKKVFRNYIAVVDFVAARPEMDRWLPEADEQRWLAAQGDLTTLAARIRLRTDGSDEEDA